MDIERQQQRSGDVTASPAEKKDEGSEHQNENEVLAEEPFLVKFEPNDPANPRNWRNGKRYYMVNFASILNWLCTWAASAYSTGTDEIVERYGVSEEAATCGLALFVLGFAFGPLLVAPASEYFGRRPVYLVSWFVFVTFQFPIIFAPNFGTILAFRLLGGAAASTPLANTGGVVHDLFHKHEDGLAMAIYALSSVCGPSFGNVLSGYITQNKGLKITFAVVTAFLAAAWVLIFFTMPETRDTVILRKRAEAKRKETGDNRWHSEQEKQHNEKGRLFKVVLIRPLHFLVTEPITLGAALYNGFTYGLIFLFNEAFPLVFGPPTEGIESYNWTHPGTVDLSFLTIVIGGFIGFIINPWLQDAYFARRLAQNNGVSVPEWRMWSSIVGCTFLPIGLMIFAWTCYPSLPWIAPLIGATIFGIGFFQLILAILAYVVDSYQQYSASALAGVVLVRNLAGAGFPLFARQLYQRLNAHWATFLLACLSIGMCPIVWLFFWRGAGLRRASPFAASHTS